MSGNLKIIESGDSVKDLKEEIIGEEAKIVLHFFEKELTKFTSVTREPKRLTISFPENRALSVKKDIDKLKADVRLLPNEDVDIAPGRWREAEAIIKGYEDKTDVLILPNKDKQTVKVIGQQQSDVNDIVDSLKAKIGVKPAQTVQSSGADNVTNKPSYANIVSHGSSSADKPKYAKDVSKGTARTNQSDSSSESDEEQKTGYKKSVYKDRKENFGDSRRTRNEQFSSSITSRHSSSRDKDFNFETKLKGGLVLKIYKASITKLEVDAIVNAANDVMMHGGGVARVISEAAGYDLDQESADYVEKYGNVKVSKNIVTTAGRLQYAGVIHAVGPEWYNYSEKKDCLKDLYWCIWNILDTCDKKGFKTVAMSAISAGIFAVPKSLCADMYIKAAVDYSEKKIGMDSSKCRRELHIIDVDTSILKCVKESFEKFQKDPSSIDIDVTLPEYFKNNPHAVPYYRHSSGHRGGVGRGRRPRGHGSSQVSNNDYSSYRGHKDNSKPKLSVNTLDYKLECPLEKQGDENFVWGGTASVYEFDQQITVKIFKGQIDKAKNMDAVVCACDERFNAPGYLHGSLKKAGGFPFEGSYKKMVSDNKHSAKLLNVYRCDGGRLGVSTVLYVAMKPVLYGNDEAMLNYKKAIINVLEKARELNLKKLIIPLFGTGNIQTNDDSLRKCCLATLKGLDSFLNERGNKSKVTEVHLVNFSDKVCPLLQEVFDRASQKNQSDSGDDESGSSSYHSSQIDSRHFTKSHRSGERVTHGNNRGGRNGGHLSRNNKEESGNSKGYGDGRKYDNPENKRDFKASYSHKDNTDRKGDKSFGKSKRTEEYHYEEFSSSSRISGKKTFTAEGLETRTASSKLGQNDSDDSGDYKPEGAEGFDNRNSSANQTESYSGPEPMEVDEDNGHFENKDEKKQPDVDAKQEGNIKFI